MDSKSEGTIMMKTETVAGITYSKPIVTVLQDSPLLVGELAGRIAYDSFDKSEHEVIRNFTPNRVSGLNADNSELLNSLAWVHHHYSVLEHLSLSYLIEGTTRGVLAELSRHRIASYTVRSTRYTMSDIIYLFAAEYQGSYTEGFFVNEVITLNVFNLSGEFERLEARQLWDKLFTQLLEVGKEEFFTAILSKDNL